jgi:hypothetical protein
VQKYFDEISQDTGKYCFGVDETLRALEAGAVETLIVWDNLETMRCVHVRSPCQSSLRPYVWVVQKQRRRGAQDAGLGGPRSTLPPFVSISFAVSSAVAHCGIAPAVRVCVQV